jgi:hypothetical protein
MRRIGPQARPTAVGFSSSVAPNDRGMGSVMDTDQPKYSAPATLLALTPLLKDAVGELGHEPLDSS